MKLAQAGVEKWLADGKPITVLLCMKLFNTTELRVIISRIRRHAKVEDRWVMQDGIRHHKVYWMPVRKVHDGRRRQKH